jgi:hypothetical protein
MTIGYQFGHVGAHGAIIRAQVMALDAEHQAIIRDVWLLGTFGVVTGRRRVSSSRSWVRTSR